MPEEKLKTLNDFDLLFKDRSDLQEEFRKWAKKNNVAEVPMSVIGWFSAKFKTQFKQELGIKYIKVLQSIQDRMVEISGTKHRLITIDAQIEILTRIFNITKEDLK